MDPKWEVPRSRLSIEDCLGEGEFGRVLKATARDLPNFPGDLYTILFINSSILFLHVSGLTIYLNEINSNFILHILLILSKIQNILDV